jgi:His/Glu/Gln/Arg/opine family amino acid ABC transporter permease subunit
MNLDGDLILRSLPLVATGLGITLKLLAYSALLGIALAVGTLLMRISGRRFLSWPAQAYIYFFRGTPILVQIFIIYYGLPQFDFIRSSFLWPILREPFGCCVLALGLNSGAYVSEILRGGVLGVDKGLHEAGKALGLSAAQRFIYVTAPIAIRLSLPAYGNEFISTLKATALASTVTLMDVTGVARTLVSETYAPYEIFIAAAVIYLAAAWLAHAGLGRIEALTSQYVKKEH